MNWFNIGLSRIRGLFRREAVLRDVDEELRLHIEMETEANVRRGMPEADARRAARRSFGNLGVIQDSAHDIRGGGLLSEIWQDARFGARMFLKKPGFTAAAVATLALGIGANTAIFSVVNAVVLRPLPFPEPDRLLVAHWRWGTGGEADSVTGTQYIFWRENSRLLKEVAAYSPTNSGFNLAGGAEPQRVRGLPVSDNFFRALGIRPTLGRDFIAEENLPNAAPVAVISNGLWRSSFGSDPAVIGKEVQLNGRACQIIGVLPGAFRLPSPAELFVPMQLVPDPRNQGHNISMLARLKRGVSLRQAQAEADTLTTALRHEFPDHLRPGEIGVRFVPLQASVVTPIEGTLWLLFGAVVFVLLIACANVANLLLARAAERRSEFALRGALGAGRGRLVRQLLVESLLLALVGGAAGLGLAVWTLRALASLIPQSLPRAGEIDLHPSAVAFALGISVLTCFLFGMVPALQSARLHLNEALKGSDARSGTKVGRRTRGLLVIGEVAVSLILLVGAALLLTSFAKLRSVDFGFNPQNLLTMQVSLSSKKYSSTAESWALQQQVIERLAAVPGVVSAASVPGLPLERGLNNNVKVPGRPDLDDLLVEFRAISPQYFATLGVPMLRGRPVSEADTQRSQAVVVINDTLARRIRESSEPLGAQLSIGGESRQIVGVVADIKEVGLHLPAEPTVYVPAGQVPDALSLATNEWFLTSWIVRTRGSVDANTLRSVIRQIDPQLPVVNVRPMTDVVGASMSDQRFVTTLMSIFALLAIVLAVVGLYGVLSYHVSQSRREIGIRLALGAQRRDVLRHIMAQGLSFTAVGVAVGLVSAFALTRLIRKLLFGVTTTEPLIFIAVALLLMVVAAIASYIPARRAMNVDPVVALRYD